MSYSQQLMHPPAQPPAAARPGPMDHEPGRRRPSRRRNNSLGVFVLALIIGSMMGATCATCALSTEDAETYFAAGDRVGVVEVSGPIVDSKKTVRAIRRFAQREDLVAIVLRVESPGGAVAPSQAIYRALRAAAEVKPVVASMGTLAASGGFWISLGADWILAEAGTITGSIGVILQTPDLQGVADALRFRIRTYKSGPLKDMGSPYRDATPADEAQFMALIDDIYEQFVTLTAERRGQAVPEVRKVADGRVMTGRAARQAGLIDEIGGLYEAAKKGVLLARARRDRSVDTSSAAYGGVEGPILVYPPDSAPDWVELLGASVGDAVQKGVAAGVREGLDVPTDSAVELR